MAAMKDIIGYIRTNYSERNKVELDTGFGLNNYGGGRFLDKSGRANVVRIGIPFWEQVDLFHFLLNLSWGLFFSLVLGIYLFANLVFAGIYYLMGTEGFSGMSGVSKWDQFWDCFYFSAQTLTTVGYGRIAPVSHMHSALSSFESLIGLLGFAIFTGLIYGRFSRPNLKLKFSENALIAPYRNITALMCRVANPKMNELLENEASIMLSILNLETQKREYHTLSLERKNIIFLALNWTLVHPIDEHSPLLGLTFEDLQQRQVEVFVVIKSFEESRAQTLYWRTSYNADEIIWGAKFAPLRVRVGANQSIIHDLSTLHDYEKAELPY
jgi:inward rectifier potassium channel